MTTVNHSHGRRMVFEQMGQVLLVLTSFLDRILLTGLLYRAWSVDAFEAWFACFALAGFVSFFEFGFNLYFNNRITFAMEQGRSDEVERLYFASNTLFAACALLSLGGVWGLAWFFVPAGQHLTDFGVALTLLLAAGNAVKLACAGVNALYRANRDYARFAVIQSVSEMLRVGAVAIGVLLGGGALVSAAISSLAVALVSGVFVLIDTSRRYLPHRFAFGWLERGDAGRMWSLSGAYFLQLIPVVMWSSLPVVILQRLTTGAGAVATFVIIRTLANLARTPLQTIGIVFGQECGRRIAVDDRDGAHLILAAGSRLFAVLSGLAVGVLALGGAPIVRFWTGSIYTYDATVLWAAMAPMALASTSILAHNVLVASNAPYLGATGRWVQVALTILAYLALPMIEPGLRMMSALAVGEVLGYATIAAIAVHRIIPKANLLFWLECLMLTLLSCGVGAAGMWLGLLLAGSSSPMLFLGALAIAGICCLPFMLMFGFDAASRWRLRDDIVRPLIRRAGRPST